MDKRRSLQKGTILDFPGMQCTIGPLVGKGSNAIVYMGSYPDQQHPDLRHCVLVKELFPYHPQGAVYRDGQNCIRSDEDAADTMRLHRISFNRGNEVHIRLLGDHPGDFDPNINTFSLHDTLYSVLGFSGGRSLDKELDTLQADKILLSTHIRRILGTLDVLGAFHGSGYLHLDISPDNILLIGDGKRERISLIDYNSVHTIDEIRNGRGIYYSAKEGYTAPEIRLRRICHIGYPTDLYALTAVFYRCITGHDLDAMQMVRQRVPDLSGAKCLEDMPDTVVSMVRHILGRGLASVSSRRYQDVSAMRMDLEELQDRIDGRGITHWALWEMGRAGVLHTVKANPALSYIKDEEKVYPIVGTQADGTSITLKKISYSLTAAEGRSAVLLGSGGMGKTTALLRMAYMQYPRYARGEPAVVYLSLYGWNNSGGDYIKNRILENLRFKPDTDSMETAKHELLRLLSSPLYTPWGSRPQLLLLLDGFNEASGRLAPLVQEITELSGLPGLRILVTARTLTAELSFSQITLRQLEGPEVTAILSDHGIIPPENKDLFQLLRTPMMLSIFIKTVLDGEKQLFVDSQEHLLSSYFSALLEKEKRNAPEDPVLGWRTEAAVYYVLPEIAGLLKTRGAALSDQELLPLIEKCCRRLSKRDMTAVFPQWIGHLSDIRGNAQNAEEWYGMMVHGILWRRLGLIIRDENGKYRIIHEMIGEYMAGIGRDFGKKFIRRQRIRTGIAVFFCLMLAGTLWWRVYLPYRSSHPTEDVKVHYDEALADNVLGTAFMAYTYSAGQYECVMGILECLQEETIDEDDHERYLTAYRKAIDSSSADHTQRALGYVEKMYATGEVMPWSEKPLDAEIYGGYIAFPADQAKKYEEYVGILEQLRDEQKLWDEFGESYIGAFIEAVTCDAYVNGKYYKILIEPELDAMENSDREMDVDHYHQYMSTGAAYPRQNEITEDCDQGPLEQYQWEQLQAWINFRENTAIALLRERK